MTAKVHVYHNGLTRKICCSANIKCGKHGNCDMDAGACVCETTWTGENCQTNVCARQHCGAHGVCDTQSIQHLEDGQLMKIRRCDCAPGYTGDRCESSPCDGVTCSGHGACDTRKGIPQCTCDVDYYAPKHNITACVNASKEHVWQEVTHSLSSRTRLECAARVTDDQATVDYRQMKMVTVRAGCSLLAW
eukprot:COSAG01_NODE_2983_length_6754_cov_3.914651_3_plen_190_part_00